MYDLLEKISFPHEYETIKESTINRAHDFTNSLDEFSPFLTFTYLITPCNLTFARHVSLPRFMFCISLTCGV